jgi:hypothetical protein
VGPVVSGSFKCSRIVLRFSLLSLPAQATLPVQGDSLVNAASLHHFMTPPLACNACNDLQCICNASAMHLQCMQRSAMHLQCICNACNDLQCICNACNDLPVKFTLPWLVRIADAILHLFVSAPQEQIEQGFVRRDYNVVAFSERPGVAVPSIQVPKQTILGARDGR